MDSADIHMDLKMSSPSFAGIKELAEGRRIDETPLIGLCEFVDHRFDCADFRLVVLLKTLYAYKDLLSSKTVERIKRSVLDFKYWIDEPGEDSLCYWSENHQMLFHTCEYMAGNLFPAEIFSNSGMTGKEHLDKAKPKILQWLRHKWEYGFIEWHSNTYYEEDIAPLSLLVDHAPEGEIQRKSALIIDLILLDMAIFSFRGFFSSSSGRCYEKQKKDGFQQDTLNIYYHAFGEGNEETELKNYRYNYEKLSSLFILSTSYHVPPVLKAIAKDRGPRVLKDSPGFTLKELKTLLCMRDFSEGGAIAWQMESFSNPETVNLTIDMFRRWKLKTNIFLQDLQMISNPILRRTGILPLLVKILNPATAGTAIQRSHNYAYKSPDYMVTTAMRHYPGTFGDQQHIWHVTMPNNTQIFGTHPGAPMFDDQARNFSPDYWVGNGILPDCVQHKSTFMGIYLCNQRKGFLERQRLEFSHVYLPRDKFHEHAHGEYHFFGRVEDSYMALLWAKPVEWGGQNELIQRGVETAWVCRLSSKRESGSFQQFIEEVSQKPLTFAKGKLQFDNLSLQYKGDFLVDGEKVSTEYSRLDTPYVRAERKDPVIEVVWENLSYTMQFDSTQE